MVASPIEVTDTLINQSINQSLFESSKETLHEVKKQFGGFDSLL